MVALITDVHYRMSPALIRALAKAEIQIYTCETEKHNFMPGARSKYVTEHFTLPQVDYTGALYELIERLGQKHHCKPAVLPVGAATLQMLAAKKERFSAVAGLCVPTPEALTLLNSKRALHQLAQKFSVAVPGEYDPENAPLPCVVKPVCGEKLGLTAAERYRICHTREQLAEAYKHFEALSGETPVVQEYLPGDGSGCSVVAEQGKISAYIGHHRLREYPVTGGPSSCCVAVEPPIAEVEKIVAATDLSGLAMFEFKEGADGTPRLLECNPRIWGSFPLTEAAGSTLPYAWVAAAWNNGNPEQAVTIPENRFVVGKKMQFFPSDLLAGLGYLKGGRPGQFFKALGDFINPAVRDGVFVWRDAAPAFAYYAGLLKRGGKE